MCMCMYKKMSVCAFKNEFTNHIKKEINTQRIWLLK